MLYAFREGSQPPRVDYGVLLSRSDTAVLAAALPNVSSPEIRRPVFESDSEIARSIRDKAGADFPVWHLRVLGCGNAHVVAVLIHYEAQVPVDAREV